MTRVNGIVDLSCGCHRHPRSVPVSEMPNVHEIVECMTHGDVEVLHVAYLSI